ncbi:acyl-CoA dehydrogenase family protein [Nocardia sp. BMG111209]|uniref:acyl-CoA dehydrogenase family protein n=1 Tax=Nocardia sp. BMG111209 TaxID=1160137 RepID=UPI000369A7FE|nr:acyl-CoA dehydrogenase family protein [Nocardia sp. BMG111209]
MNLEPTAEQSALRETTRRFLADQATVADHVRPLLNDPTGMTDPVWRGLAAIGATAVLVPAEHGGLGLSMVEAAMVGEEFGAALHPGPWLSSAVAATRALHRFGATDPYAGLAAGTTIATVALPWAGASDLSHERDGAVLHGVLDEVPDAAAADVLLVAAEHHGPAVLIAVPTASPAVRIEARSGIDQSRKMFRVTLDDAPGVVLATADYDVVAALTDDVLVAGAADALGAASRLLAMTLDHAKTRRQFGRPIGGFQAVAHLCVDMYETVELARSAVMYASWAADAADPAERHLAALRAKALSGRLAGVGDQAIQVFGGIGYTWEHDAHLYLKRLLSYSRLLGSPDRYLERVGRELVRSHETSNRTGM